MALIEVCDALGCSIREVSEHIDAEELEYRLVYQLIKMGFTSDQEKIRKQRTDSFLQNARSDNWGN